MNANGLFGASNLGVGSAAVISYSSSSVAGYAFDLMKLMSTWSEDGQARGLESDPNDVLPVSQEVWLMTASEQICLPV